MNKRSLSTIQSLLLLAGAFTFAFLLGEMVHELGHYLAHVAYGRAQLVQIHLDPFGGSRILQTGSPPEGIRGKTAAAGPLLNLSLGLFCLLLLWRRRKPLLLPLLLWGPIAAVQEGVNLSLGLLAPGSDAAWIAAAGLPQALLLAAGVLLLLAGSATIARLLPFAGVAARAPFRATLVTVLIGMGSLLLLRYTYSALHTPAAAMENLVPLLFSLLLALVVAALHRSFARYRPGDFSAPRDISTPAVSLALLLGTSLFLLQVLAA